MVITVHKYDETLRKQQIEETIETLKKEPPFFFKKIERVPVGFYSYSKPSMSAPRRSARIAAMNAPSTPVKASQLRECPPAPVKVERTAELRAMMDEMVQAAVLTFQAIRRIRDIVKEHAEPDELTAAALVSLTRASWAVEDAFELKMRQPILNGDEIALRSVPNFIALLRAVTVEANKDADVFQQYRVLPRSLVIAVQTIGTTIKSAFYND
jgi:hypothetical protein